MAREVKLGNEIRESQVLDIEIGMVIADSLKVVD